MTAIERTTGDLRRAVPVAVTTDTGRLFTKAVGRDQRGADQLHHLGRLWQRRPGEGYRRSNEPITGAFGLLGFADAKFDAFGGGLSPAGGGRLPGAV